MADDNPFVPLPVATAAPEITTSSTQPWPGVVRDGDLAVSPMVATWPARCVCCNKAVPTAARTLTLSWFPLWVYALAIFGFLVAIIVGAFLRRTAILTVGFCDACAERRQRRVAVSVGLLGLGIVGMCVGAQLHGAVTVLSFLAVVAGLIGLGLFNAVVNVKRIEGGFVWVGVGRTFLESLPSGRPGAEAIYASITEGSRPSLDD